MEQKPHIVVLGAGPAGLGAAYQLAKRGLAEVTVIERSGKVGGLSSSFKIADVPVDYGSHRLHGECRPDILEDLENVLGLDLVKKKRNGRIMLQRRWISFPLSPLNAMITMPKAIIVSSLWHLMAAKFSRKNEAYVSFADVMRDGVGPALCRAFYFPYARKIWGKEPEQISSVQAMRRVSTQSVFGLIAKIFKSIPLIGSSKSRYFYYPRGGYGQISEQLSHCAQSAGARVLTDTSIEEISRLKNSGLLRVVAQEGTVRHVLEADQVWSTIPLSSLIDRIKIPVPHEVTTAAQNLQSRAMVLVYLAVRAKKVTEYDTHYFPEEEFIFSRVSEPKNFSGVGPSDRTVLCAEIPTSIGSEIWTKDDKQIAGRVVDDLTQIGVLASPDILEAKVIRLPGAYPIYHCGFETSFKTIDDWISSIDGILTFGRQGLFAHNNLHHVLEMAYSAADSIDETGQVDRMKWQGFRSAFDRQVVVD